MTNFIRINIIQISAGSPLSTIQIEYSGQTYTTDQNNFITASTNTNNHIAVTY